MIPYRSNTLSLVPQSLAKRLEILDAISRLADQYGKFSPTSRAYPLAVPAAGNGRAEEGTPGQSLRRRMQALALCRPPPPKLRHYLPTGSGSRCSIGAASLSVTGCSTTKAMRLRLGIRPKSGGRKPRGTV